MALGRWVTTLGAAVALALVTGCGAPAEPDESSEPDFVPADEGGGKADSAKSDFFAPSRFYFIRVSGWDPGRMAPSSLAEAVSVPGAKLSIHRADPASQKHCPDDEVSETDLVYRSPLFSLKTSGNFTANTPKSSYKFKFTKKEARLYGMRSINLKSMWNDVSQMREAIAWSMFDDAGVPSSRHVYAKLCINDRYYGLYSMIEDVDAGFIESHWKGNEDGNLYKAYWLDIGPADLAYRKGSNGDDGGKQYFKASDLDDRSYQLKTNEETDDDPALQSYDDLAAFVRVINGVGLPGGAEKFETEDYAKSVESIFDVKTFLRWAGANLLLGSWDNYWRTPANYYLYNSGKRGGADAFMAKQFFHWVPWDYDNSLGSDFFGTDWQYADIVSFDDTKLPLLKNLLANTRFRAYYLDSLEHLLNTAFNEKAIVDKKIGSEGSGGLWDRVRFAAFLESDSATGAPHTGRQFTNDQVYWNGFQHHELNQNNHELLGILHYVRMRHDSAREQLTKWREKQPAGSSGAHFPAKPEAIPSVE